MSNWSVILLMSIVVVYHASVHGEGRSSLRLVNLLFRHGDRTFLRTYPKNPHPVSETSPEGLGELTKLGIQQEYSLGRFLRRRYNDFLTATYVPSEVNVISASSSRCIMSALANLAGMFPPQGDQVWNKDINWQPIPVRTLPAEEDWLIAFSAPCPRYQQLHSAVLASEKVRNIELQNKGFYSFLEVSTGLTNISIGDLWYLLDVVTIEEARNFTLPTWANTTVVSKLRELSALWRQLSLQTQGERFLSGGILREWIALMNTKMTDTSSRRKLNMYSGHDTTINAAMVCLNVSEIMFPPLTSTLIMELHEASPAFFHIELYFRNKTSADADDDTQPHPLTIPGCKFKCPFSAFVSLTKELISTKDWLTECSLGEQNLNQKKFQTELLTATVILCIASIVFLIMIVFLFCRLRRIGGGGYVNHL